MKSSAGRNLKTALVLALQLAEKGVDGLPIPGVKGCISGILKIIEQEELRETNIETFQGLLDVITEFEEVTVVRLSKERKIPDDLQDDVERLAKKLQDIPQRYTQRIGQPSAKGRIKSFLLASDNAKALNSLGDDVKNAVQQFQTALLLNMQLAEMKREDNRLIDKLLVEHKAIHNAHCLSPIELCEPGTRVSLLENVAEWAEDATLNHPPVLWLNGRAGVGKSTIAKTLATRFDAAKTLGGSFVFSKANGVTDGAKVFTTLAHQLAHHLPEFKDHLVAAIRANEASIRAEITQQFTDLFAAPLSQIQSSPTTVVILDALDECTPETLAPVLTLIVENIMSFPFIHFVITSRPEKPIREILQRYMERIRSVDLSNTPTSEDIGLYLRTRLSKVHVSLVGDADQNKSWPVEDDLASLVRMANNLFIFASTAVRFIANEHVAMPQRRLENILQGQHAGQRHPFSNLDIMFLEILRNALPEGEDDLHERFQSVVGTIIFAGSPHSVNTLRWLLAPRYRALDIRHSLNFLHSVFIVPEDDDEIGLLVYHKSFVDFITDQNRCTLAEAYLHPQTHHAKLCIRYLRITRSHIFPSSIEFEFHRKTSSFLYAFNVLSKAFYYWIHHLQALKHGQEDEKTKDFLQSVSESANTMLARLKMGIAMGSEMRKKCGLLLVALPMMELLCIQEYLQRGIDLCSTIDNA